MILHLAALKFHGIPWNVPWNSLELSNMSFGGTRVPWNSMEYSMEFHGTNWYFIWRHQSSKEFHGIFHGIPWNTCVICNGALLIPWNHMELGDFFIWPLYRVPRNSMVYPMEVQGSMTLNKMTISKFHGNSMELNDISFGGTRLPWNIAWISMEHVSFEMAPS